MPRNIISHFFYMELDRNRMTQAMFYGCKKKFTPTAFLKSKSLDYVSYMTTLFEIPIPQHNYLHCNSKTELTYEHYQRVSH